MIKNICIYITLVFSILTISSEVNGLTVDSYEVTQGFEMSVPNGQKVYFYKYVYINYQSGRVVLSRNPDGTGEALVGESIDASVSHDSFTYKTNSSSCEGPITMKPLDITHLLKKGPNNLLVRFRTVWCSNQKVDPIYVVHFNDYKPTITPFLDLPWDYKSKNMSFDDAGVSMYSYFDHQYPFLSAGWFLNETNDSNTNILKYDGSYSNQQYSSHDGYDYALPSNVKLNDPVLAAANGTASFHNECTACGNAIHIDHGNGYQTRYYHLQPDELITNNPHNSLLINSGQIIGKVGLTGRTDGAHIHFMLVHDKNGDGNFEDNIPDGIVDPYGWQGDEPDPWEQFSFTQNGVNRTGARSTYLWKNNLSNIQKTVSPEGGTYSANRYTFTFPSGTTDKDLILSINPVPQAESSAELEPIGYVVEATANDGFGNLITEFKKLFTITMKLMLSDFSRYQPESLSIYSSSDGKTWQKESSQVDLDNRTATTQVDHLTYFAFMGEKKDSIAPATTLLINNQADVATLVKYHEPITVSLATTDEPFEESLGIEHSFIKINDEDWQLYENPIEISEFGEYKINYYSIDKDGNSEEIKTHTIELDEKTDMNPEFKIYFNINEDEFKFETVTEEDELLKKQIQIKRKEYTEYGAINGTYSTKLTTFFPTNYKKDVLRFSSIQYDNSESLPLKEYRFIVFNKKNKKDVEKIEQIFQQGEIERVRLIYNSKEDSTTVIRKNNENIIEKKQVDGFKRLIIFTEKGKLLYVIH